MKRLLSNYKFMSIVAFIVFIIGIYTSIKYNDPLWFQRFGSILVGIGIILLARTFIIGEDLKPEILGSETNLNINGKEHYKKIGKSIPEYVKKDIESRNAIGIYGPIISFIGTFIWGFGDLIITYFLN